jgi:4-carboxymuconolactone decarboxylase
MPDAIEDQNAYAAAERLLGVPLVLPLGPGEPEVGNDFKRLATRHAFGDSWTRPGLDTRSRALISATIAAALGTHEPLRGQLRIALNNRVTEEEIVELFILRPLHDRRWGPEPGRVGASGCGRAATHLRFS